MVIYLDQHRVTAEALNDVYLRFQRNPIRFASEVQGQPQPIIKAEVRKLAKDYSDRYIYINNEITILTILDMVRKKELKCEEIVMYNYNPNENNWQKLLVLDDGELNDKVEGGFFDFRDELLF